MSNYSNKQASEELFEVKFDAEKHSKRPKGTYTSDDNGEVLRSVPVGHPCGRTVDPNFPSRTTDPRPGIGGNEGTGLRPGTIGAHASTKDFKKFKATSDLKSGPENATKSGSILCNPSVFQTSVLRAGNNSLVSKLQQDPASVVDDLVPVTDLSKSSKPNKKAKFDQDPPSPPPTDYLSEADRILLDLEKFDHTCETKCRSSISNPSHGSIELIGHSKWLAGQSSTSFEAKHSSSEGSDSDMNVDELLAPYLDDTARENQKKIAKTAESQAGTRKHPQVETISARIKKIRQNMHDPDPQVEKISERLKKIRHEMGDPDPQVEKISERLKKIKQEMGDPDPQDEKISARLKKMRREMRDSDPQANQNTVVDTPESLIVNEKRPQVGKISERLKMIRREMRDPDPKKTEYLAGKEEVLDHFKVPKQRSKKKKQWEVIKTNHFIDETEPISSLENNKEKPRPDTPVPSASYSSNSSSALEEFAAMHRAQPPALLVNRKKLKYTHDNIIPTLPSRHSPSPPSALDEFAAMTQTLPHPLLANQKKLTYTHDNVIPILPTRPSPTPPTALDDFVASNKTLPHPLLANQKKLTYTHDNVIPILPTRPSPTPPTALDDFVASNKSLPHPLLANQKKLTYTHDNVIPILPTRPSPTPPTALDDFVASNKTLPHPLLANQKKLTYTHDNVIPILPTRPSPTPPTALDDFVASNKSLPHPLLANQKKLTYTHDNVIPILPTRPSPTPPTALDDFVASNKSLPHPLLANQKKLTYTHDNVIPTLPSRPSPTPPTALDEFAASHKSLPHPLLANQKKLTYTHDNVIPTLPSRPSPTPPTALDEFAASHKSLPYPLLANQKKLTYTQDNVIPILPTRLSPTPPTALDEFAASHKSLPHPLLANQKKLTYAQDNVIPTLLSRPSPTPPTALGEFAAKFPSQHPSHSNTTLSTNSSHSSISLLEEVSVIHSNRKQTQEPVPRSIPPKKPARTKLPKNPARNEAPKKPARTKPPKKPARQPPSKNASKEVLYDIFGRELDNPTKSLHMPMTVPDLDNSSRTDETCSTSKDDDERLPARKVQSLPMPQTNIVFQGHATIEPQEPILNIRHIMLDIGEKKKKKTFIKKLIPCVKSPKGEEEKYEHFDSIETIDYLQVKDVESTPPKVIRDGIVTRILSFVSSLLGRH